jgi:glycogen operon protein
MILHGDETGRTQRGNNNTYCQDNELSWVEWSWLDSGDSDPRRELLEFTGRVLALRRDHPVFRRRRFLGADAVQEGGDIAWFGVRGQAMTDADWAAGEARALAVFLDGERIAEPDERGRRIVDDSFLLFFNAQWEDVAFTVPSTPYPYAWLPELDTAQSSGPRLDGVPGRGIAAGSELVVAARSILVLRRPADGRTAELGRRRAEVPR